MCLLSEGASSVAEEQPCLPCFFLRENPDAANVGLCHHLAMPSGASAPSMAREAAVTLIALSVTGLVGAGWSLGFRLDNAHNGLLAVSFTSVGLYVVRVRPGHREGRLFVAVGVLHAVMFFGRQYGSLGADLPAADWIRGLGVWPVSLAIALTGWTLMAFPDGQLLSPRWRLAAAVMVAVASANAMVSALWPADNGGAAPVFAHRLGAPSSERLATWQRGVQISYVLFQALWTASVVTRMQRARGDEIRQMRWLVYAVVVDLVLLLGGLAVVGSPVLGLLALPLIPLAAGIAILKYRLYEIDPVINKTIVITAMTILITAGYVAIVVGVGSVVPAGRGILWLIATAAVAVSAEPLRRRAQRLADRLVYGHRATPYEALAQLSTRIDDPPEELLAGIATTVANAVGAREVVVWVGTAERLVPVASWPAGTFTEVPRSLRELELERPDWLVRPVSHRGTVNGALTLRKPGESLSSSEEQILSNLVAQTALVIVRQQQAEQLQAAARRIVSAEDAARRRIERDLHDGAQQRLVTLGMELGALAERAADPEVKARAKELRARLLDATAELRELARGLHPMVLTEQGLGAALEALADRSTIPIKLEVAVGRLPAEIEATIYFLVSEALTNAARHSCAHLIRLYVERVEAGVRVEVADDGRGGAVAREGTGLQGLADRLAALGSQIQVESPVGGGTRIRAVLPCE